MHLSGSLPAAFVRCHEVEQTARLGVFFPSPPAGHATPRTQHPVVEVREGKGEDKGVEAGTEDLTGASDPSTWETRHTAGQEGCDSLWSSTDW